MHVITFLYYIFPILTSEHGLVPLTCRNQLLWLQDIRHRHFLEERQRPEPRYRLDSTCSSWRRSFSSLFAFLHTSMKPLHTDLKKIYHVFLCFFTLMTMLDLCYNRSSTCTTIHNSWHLFIKCSTLNHSDSYFPNSNWPNLEYTFVTMTQMFCLIIKKSLALLNFHIF